MCSDGRTLWNDPRVLHPDCCGAWAAPPVGRDPLHGTSSSGPLLWSPAHSKLWHGWVIRCVLILQGLFTLSCSAETQFCRPNRDVFHEQSPLTPILQYFSAHPSKYTCRNSGVSMAPASPDKWNSMIYSQVLSFERIPAGNILIYRGSPFPSLLQALQQLACPLKIVIFFCLVFLHESCKVGVWGNLCFLTAPICVCPSLLTFGTTIAKYSLSFV